ncbi:hypothetical protein BDR03DRAFT_939916 [Suillus americanus]|nr:hypothetical protein BDR03DRAFT_939916 [Suillus americanus]
MITLLRAFVPGSGRRSSMTCMGLNKLAISCIQVLIGFLHVIRGSTSSNGKLGRATKVDEP